MNTFVRNWVLPLALGLVLFAFIRPTVAQRSQQGQELRDYLATNTVDVGSEVGRNGFSQIYYTWQSNKQSITDTLFPNGEPYTSGEYIVWMARASESAWQIFSYHIPTDTTVQLTDSGNNANPKVSNGMVVWERWVDDTWQIFLFDGIRTTQLTEGDTSVHPEIEDGVVVYARKGKDGQWRAIRYSIADKTSEEIGRGIGAKFPKIRRDKAQVNDEPVSSSTSTPAASPSTSAAPSPSGSPAIEASVLPIETPTSVPESSVAPTPTPSPTAIPSTPPTVTEEDIVEELEEAVAEPPSEPSPEPAEL